MPSTGKKQKDSESDIDSLIYKEKERMLDELFHMYPNLENDKKNIINRCLNSNTKATEEYIESIGEGKKYIVLDKITHDGRTFYKDRAGGLWNDKTQLVGTTNIDNGGKESYIIFEDENGKIKDKTIKDFLNK